MNQRIASLVLIFFCIALTSAGQSRTDKWKRLDSAVSSGQNLENIREELLVSKNEAIRTNNPADLARSFYLLMRIADRKTEDTLYFKNSLFIDSILNGSSSSIQLKAIMHLLKGKRILEFRKRFSFRKSKNLVSSYDPVYDYARLSDKQNDSLAVIQFKAALSASSAMKNIPVEELLWLSNDPLAFLFKPDFADIIYAEQVLSIPGNSGRKTEAKVPDWLFLSQDAFISMPDSLIDLSEEDKFVFNSYKQWMAYHGPSDPQALYYIETMARKFFYSGLKEDTAVDHAYEQYLKKLLSSPYSPVKANAVYQLVLRWNSEGGKYNPFVDEYSRLYYPALNRDFKPAFRLYYAQAMELLDRNQLMMDSFAFMQDILQGIRQKIESPGVEINASGVQTPEAPILAFLKYKNINQLHIRIIPLSPFDTTRTNIPYLLSLPFVRDTAFLLQQHGDYQWHNTYLKLDGLPTGHYAVVYSDSTISGVRDRTNFFYITVSNIAVINNDQRVFVLDRKTGFPIQGATVIPRYGHFVFGTSGLKSFTEGKPMKVNSSGYVIINDLEEVSDIKVINQQDSLRKVLNEPDIDLPDELYDEEYHDNLMEYYEENIQLHFFTDRAIYRPGQTVHYKGIFITRNPKTGEPLVLNWKNLKFPFFKKLAYKMAAKFSHRKIELTITDPFSREMDTIKVLPNKYGSFSGTYTLPKSAATGEWNFDTDDFEMGDKNDGAFQVEEYKRPTFQLSFEKPKTELRLGDEFTVKAKVRSFAGAQLANVLIRYSVTASGQIPDTDVKPPLQGRYVNYTILEGEAFTNEKGELQLTVKDSTLARYVFSDEQQWGRQYYITAEAVDATGESHEEKTDIYLSTRPVQIKIPVRQIMERSELSPVYISTESAFAGMVKKMVNVCIYKTQATQYDDDKEVWPKVDTWLHSREEIKNLFAIDDDEKQQEDKKPQLVFQQDVWAGGDDKFNMPADLLQSGDYTIEVTSKENGKITGQASRTFTVFDKGERALPGNASSFHFMKYNSVEKGQQISWVTGNAKKDIFSIYHLSYYVKTKKGRSLKYVYDIKPEKKGLNEWQYTMPKDAVEEVLLTHLYIYDNTLHRHEQRVYIPDNSSAPEIIVEKYRSRLVPGEKETFTVSVRTKEFNTAAELMTTMYDASLDKLEKHEWVVPRLKPVSRLYNQWDVAILSRINSKLYADQIYFFATMRKSDTPVWWAGESEYSSDLMSRFNFEDGKDLNNSLSGTLAGLTVLSSNDLNEVLVVGYGSAKARSMTASISIRGSSSVAADFDNFLVILDGVVYTGGISKIDLNTITASAVLKGADAIALYGSKAANGVLVLSTKGPIQLGPLEQKETPVVVRKDFSETAFFYPKILAGKDGYYTISFTLPESVTEWKWKMLAHTKKAAFAYAERTLISQLPLMVQPDMPRFLYQGDTLYLKTRISNLDSNKTFGSIKCRIEDMVTGEEIGNKLLELQQQDFSVAATSNGVYTFRVTVPADLIHPLRVRVTAVGNSSSDGEEHIVPILSRKALVSQQVPFVFNGPILTPSYPADATPYGIAAYINPKPQASLLNSLPYLAEYPYNCSEQTFNKMLAHALAIKIVRTDTAVQAALKKKNIAINEPGSDSVSPGTTVAMPWLQLDQSTRLHQQQLARLLDTFSSRSRINEYFNVIIENQNADGGFSWFNGGRSDAYISFYLLAGLGKMKEDSLLYRGIYISQDLYNNAVSKLISYCDSKLMETPGSVDLLSSFYARSYWIKEYPVEAATAHLIDSLLKQSWKDPAKFTLGRQALLISSTLRFSVAGTAFYQAALEQLESIRQRSISDTHGVRWKELADADDLNMQTEEWLVKLAEAFEAGKFKDVTQGIIQWLLQTKHEHNWSTTKSTADAVTLLSRQKAAIVEPGITVKAMADKNVLQVTDELLTGHLYDFRNLYGQAFPSQVLLEKNTQKEVSGSINYYYFTEHPPATQLNGHLRLSKTLSRYNKETGSWDSVRSNTRLHIADKIRVVLTIETSRKLQYVFIDDKRAAAFEPVDALSGYDYGNGLGYYRSVKDEGFHFFAEHLPAGISAISYEMVVAKEGSFTNGMTSLQCMYQPAEKVYSSGFKVNTVK